MNELIIGSHVSFNNKDQLLGAVKEEAEDMRAKLAEVGAEVEFK